MRFHFRFVSLVGFLAASAMVYAQSSELTAREMFLAARDKATAVKTPSSSAKKSPPPLRTEPPIAKAPREKESPPVRSRPSPANPDVMPASYSSSPLGLRYTILKREDGRSVEVPTDSVFHNGDKIHIAVEVTDPGYLYIVTRGSSGNWEVLFPSAKIENGNNHVEAQGTYQVPQGYVFTFSGKPGTEKLFIVFSRTAEAEIDNLIYSLQEKKQEKKSAPNSEPVLMAKASPISDSLVSSLRDTYARDLIIEPVNESAASAKPGKRPEHTVYVVNPKGGSDSRVVADISLIHQ